MKNKFIIFLFIIIMFSFYNASAIDNKNLIILDKGWKINIGDSSEYREKGFNDSNWRTDDFKHKKVVNKLNDRNNKIYWVRDHFSIDESFQNEDLMLLISNLSNGHEVYINGFLIGKTEIYPNNNYNEWNLKHIYLVPSYVLNYGSDNVIAIRSYSSYEYGYSQTPVTLGPYSSIQQIYRNTTMSSLDIYYGLFVLTLCMGTFFITIYIKNRISKSHLYFGLICIFSSIYYTNFIIYKLPLGYLNYQKIIFISLHMLAICYLPFIKGFLGIRINKFDKIIATLFIFISIIGCTLCQDTSSLYIFRTKFLYMFFILFIYYFIIMAKAIINKHKNIIFIVLSLLLSLSAAGYDTIMELNNIISPFGFQLNGIVIIIFLIPISLQLIWEYNDLYNRACTDGLTGLYNHVFFKNELFNLTNKLNFSAPMNLSLIMFDIDNFKKFNDTYGHLYGDYVLKYTAKIILDNSPKGATVARYGGEEFVVLLKETDIDSSFDLGDNIRKKVSETNLDLSEGTKLHITISAGITTVLYKDIVSVEEIISQADKALYISKKSGKNLTTHFSKTGGDNL